jgi:hypothetical protein
MYRIIVINQLARDGNVMCDVDQFLDTRYGDVIAQVLLNSWIRDLVFVRQTDGETCGGKNDAVAWLVVGWLAAGTR